MVWRFISNVVDFGRTILILFMLLVMLIAASTLHDIGLTGDLLTPLEPAFDYIKRLPEIIDDTIEWFTTPKTNLPNNVSPLPLIFIFVLTVLANIFNFGKLKRQNKIEEIEETEN